MKIKILIKESNQPQDEILEDTRKIAKEFLSQFNKNDVKNLDCPSCNGNSWTKCENPNCDSGWDDKEDDICITKCSQGWKNCKDCGGEGRMWDFVEKQLQEEIFSKLWKRQEKLSIAQGLHEISDAMRSEWRQEMRDAFGRPTKISKPFPGEENLW